MISGLEKNFEKFLIKKEIDYTSQPKIFGCPDFILNKYKTLIFIDGCFWHFCKDHFKTPQKNKEFWIKKKNKTIRRDRYVTDILKNDGWKVLRIWEHEIKNNLFNIRINF